MLTRIAGSVALQDSNLSGASFGMSWASVSAVQIFKRTLRDSPSVERGEPFK